MEEITFRRSSLFVINRNNTSNNSNSQQKLHTDGGDDADKANDVLRYKTIRVYVPLKLYVNQQKISDSAIVSPSLSIQTFSN